MYTPAHFAPDSDASARFLAEVVAGDLVTSTDSGLVATFLPVLLDAGPGPHGSLVGHLARNNDQWQQAVSGVVAGLVQDGRPDVAAIVDRSRS